ncbi:DnaB-like helicase N-terminal domain-containing protein [Streptomyces sp. CT34]|uniref:DnaB-like helicase N-terminal domain-containing protein n=1 Tax=Streptomyces sp. CT34 TaxID=1553907 RepID=UPI0005B7D4DF|nr:DnaB-like helicase N-terminal domain-containing protein [Streptomyces sp. CT34]
MTTLTAMPAPADREAAQRARVGRMLVAPDSIPETAAALLPEDLSGPLAVVYVSVLAVHAAGEPVDAITVGVHLHRRGRFAEVGGSAYLTALAQAGTGTAALEASPTFDRPADVVPMRVPAQVATACRPSPPSKELTEVWDKVIAEFVAAVQ